ncbi:MAG: serine hydrolase domain-containing protein, partial [Longimicrobiales bacterium]
PYAAGSLCSTAADMVTWLTALHGGSVLSERSYREMTTPARLNDGTELRYGMGLSLGTDVRGARMIGHGGAISGFGADASWYPDEQLAVVVLINSNGPISPSALASELAGEIIPAVRPVARAFTGDAGPLIGKYAGPSRGRRMTAEVTPHAQGGVAISVNGSDARPLAWVDGWSFRSGTVHIVFERDGDTGPATVLRFDTGGGHYVLRRQ